VNTLGRRKLLLQSFLWSGLALLLLGLLRDGPSMIILLMFGLYALFIGGAQVLQLVYPNEIFPTEIRAGAVGVGTSLSRIGAAVGTWLVPVSLQTVGIGTTMYIAAAITFFGLIVSWFLAPETNARSLEDAASLDDSPRQKVAMSAPLTRRNTL
jgi:putative MFS transporter